MSDDGIQLWLIPEFLLKGKKKPSGTINLALWLGFHVSNVTEHAIKAISMWPRLHDKCTSPAVES